MQRDRPEWQGGRFPLRIPVLERNRKDLCHGYGDAFRPGERVELQRFLMGTAMRLLMKPFLGKRQSSGLTLIELLIALSIGAVGMTAVISLFVVAMANNSRSHRDTAATLLSQSVLEQILLAGTNNVAA